MFSTLQKRPKETKATYSTDRRSLHVLTVVGKLHQSSDADPTGRRSSSSRPRAAPWCCAKPGRCVDGSHVDFLRRRKDDDMIKTLLFVRNVLYSYQKEVSTSKSERRKRPFPTCVYFCESTLFSGHTFCSGNASPNCCYEEEEPLLLREITKAPCWFHRVLIVSIASRVQAKL